MNLLLLPWSWLASEIILGVGAFTLVAVALSPWASLLARREHLAGAAILGLSSIAAILSVGAPSAVYDQGLFVLHPTGQAFKALVSLLAMFSIALVVPGKRGREEQADLTALYLMAVFGIQTMIATRDLLLMMLGLEISGLCLIALVATCNRTAVGAEAAFKWMLQSGAATVVSLYGLSLIYGFVGTTRYDAVARGLLTAPQTWLTCLALLAFAVAPLFKLASAPFHMWAPDVYETATPTVVGLVTSASKAGAAYLLAVIGLLGAGLALPITGVAPLTDLRLACMAILSGAGILLGTLAAFAQRNLPRLMAYSGVGHAGFLLIGLASGTAEGLQASLFYAVTYVLAALGVFLVFSSLGWKGGPGSEDRLFAGLMQTQPLKTVLMLLFLVSLAGLPPLAGFMGKFNLMLSFAGGPLPLIAKASLLGVALVSSGASFVYYWRWIRVMFDPEIKPGSVPETNQMLPTALAIFLALLLFLLGIQPALLFNLIGRF